MAELFVSQILPWTGIALSIYLVYFTFRYQYSKQPLEQQLYKAYLPIFLILEPFLYKKIEDIGIFKVQEIIVEINTIINENYELVHPSIVHYCRLLDKRLNNPNHSKNDLNDLYITISSLVDREFERTRRKMFLPTRDVYYRLNNDQFTSKGKALSIFLLTFIPPLLVVVALCYLAIVLIVWSISNQ